MISIEQCELPAKTQQNLCDVFKHFSKVKKVILYGSRAKGTFKNGSDIDLTIEAFDMNLNELFLIEEKIEELNLPYTFDLSLFHYIDNNKLLDHINRVGLLFYKSE